MTFLPKTRNRVVWSVALVLLLTGIAMPLATLADGINKDSGKMTDGQATNDAKTPERNNETYRPQFHFTAEKNWLNDPNGLVYYRGEYHLFFQHNPQGINWGNMTWGHAVSRDLVHWTQLPNALEPDALGTMFSGSAVVDSRNTSSLQTGKEKVLVALYTAAGGTSPESQGQPFTQCLAYSNDRGITWTKYSGNPVLKHILGGNRDPKVVWYAPTHRWIMALYLDGNTFAFFSSPDLKAWTHLQDINVPGCDECPDFFELPVTGNPSEHYWVWTAANGHYLVGTFDGQHFTPLEAPLTSDYGANFYAVQTYSDIPASDGRRIQIAWMRDGKYPGMPFNQQMSFPCELTLRQTDDGLRLFRQPVQEIRKLYRQTHHVKPSTLNEGDTPLSDLHGEFWDITAEIELQTATEFGISVRGESVRYSVADKTLTCLGRSAPLTAQNNRITLRLLVDRTSLEVYGNEGQVSLSSCCLLAPENQSLHLFAHGGTVKLLSLTAHQL